jgi:hypothetical protein
MGKYFWLGLTITLIIIIVNYILVVTISEWFVLLLIPEAPLTIRLGRWCAEKDN